MAHAEVYRGEAKIASFTFDRDLRIMRDIPDITGELRWRQYHESGGGDVLIWLQMGRDTGILVVPPDWQLIVDGVPWEQKAHVKVRGLTGKAVELRYRDYRFVFQL